jgi:hypothetical protein
MSRITTSEPMPVRPRHAYQAIGVTGIRMQTGQRSGSLPAYGGPSSTGSP